MSRGTNPAKASRRYSEKTLKILFNRSLFCAFPGCFNRIIQPGTGLSNAMVLGQIAHIEAASDRGPRSNRALSAQERNQPENLVLLCPTHHTIVDGQYETYPTVVLRQWKQAQLDEADRAASLIASGTEHPSAATTALADRELASEISALRRTRFFVGIDAPAGARALATRILEGDLSLASAAIRSEGMGWCLRLLAFAEEPNIDQLANNAARLPETEIFRLAKAFLRSAAGEERQALAELASMPGKAARTAAFQIAIRHREPGEALDWLSAAGLAASDLDADGKVVLLLMRLNAGQWSEALQTATSLAQDDFEQQPALLYAAALANLVAAVPLDLRRFALGEVPLEARQFPLASDSESMARLRAAQELFRRCAETASELGAPEAARACSVYRQWLRLRDPLDEQSAKAELRRQLGGPDQPVAWVPLAVQFGLPVDLAQTEREIDRQAVLSGETSTLAAKARLALAFAQPTPAAAAAYIERHRATLAGALDPAAVDTFRAELLATSGDAEGARSVAERLPPELSARLRAMLEASAAGSPNELERDFETTKSTATLAQLADFYERNGPPSRFVERAALLFETTRSQADAERLAEACVRAGDWARLAALLADVGDLIPQSPALASAGAWQAYWDGDLTRARTLLDQVLGARSARSDRMLVANLAITSGDWEGLISLVDEQWLHREERPAEELLWMARLGQLAGSPRSKDLVQAAVGSSEDPHLLLAGYVAATEGGWEEEPQPSRWLNEAAEKSGEDGPIQRVSLKEIADRQPDWSDHVEETWRSYRKGEMPIVLAAHALRRSMIELQLQPLLVNRDLADLRRRAVVPLFSGVREPVPISGRAATFDVTALLTLAAFGLAENALDLFEKVVLPHETLSWLFGERQRAAFHQPSRFRRAADLKQLLDGGQLTVFRPRAAVDEPLAADVGTELAAMLTAAADPARSRQTLVVRPGRVHRAGSLLDEEADVNRFEPVLTGCQAVLDRLRALGALTLSEHERGTAYLKLQEGSPWPNGPAIERGAELLLDDVAVSYFQHIGVLGKLGQAGFNVRVPLRAVEEADGLLSLQRNQGRIEAVILDLRQAIVRAMKKGRVVLASAAERIPQGDDRFESHPTLGALRLADEVDVVVSDDRYLNRHRRIGNEPDASPVLCTLDVLDELRARETLSRGQWLELRTGLRQGGAILVPLEQQELCDLLEASGGSDEITAELKAVRDNLLLVRMKGWLALPQEAGWFDRTMLNLALALRAQWTEDADPVVAKAHSLKLLPMMFMARWASAFDGLDGETLARLGDVVALKRLALVPSELDEGPLRDAYEAFFEEEVVSPVLASQPAAVDQLVTHLREIILERVGEEQPADE